MKISSLLRSSLLAAGLLGCSSVVQAGSAFPASLHSSDFHYRPHDYHGCKHTPRWHSDHRHDRAYHSDRHWKPHDNHRVRYQGENYRGRWYKDRGHWPHGYLDDRNDGGRHVQQPRSAGIGYTGRS